MNFDTATSIFTATYTVDTSIDAPTVIFSHHDFYYHWGHTTEVYDSDGTRLTNGAGLNVTSVKPDYLGIQVVDPKYNGHTLKIKYMPLDPPTLIVE